MGKPGWGHHTFVKKGSNIRHAGQILEPSPETGGFTMVELLVALTVLLIVSLCFIPLLVYIAEASEANHNRLEANKLASSVIEQIRALNFDDIGNCEVTQDDGGNITGRTYPYNLKGEVPRTINKKINNVNFTVKTVISWDDNYNYDYKKIAVTVTSRDPFSGKSVCYAEVYTTVARNGEEVVLIGGDVKVTLVDDNGEPVPDVEVTLTSSDGAVEQKMTTDEQGMVFFGALPVTESNGNHLPRTYKISVDPAYTVKDGPASVNVEFDEAKEVTLTVEPVVIPDEGLEDEGTEG